MARSGVSVQQTGSLLNNAGHSAPSYDGQFGPWVMGIASEGNGQSKFLGVGVGDLGLMVGRKADQFHAVDSEAIFGITSIGSVRENWLLQNKFLVELFGLSWLERISKFWFILLPGMLLPGFIIPRPVPGSWWRPGPGPWPWWPPKWPWQKPPKPPEFWPKPKDPSKPIFPIIPPVPGLKPKPLPPPALPDLKPEESRRPQPVPLAKTAEPTKEGSCALYAQARRPDLGPVGGSGNGNTGAGNYIHKYESEVFQTAPTDNLQEKIAPGYALIWEIGHPQADKTYGHVAIVEEVYPDYVIVSQAGSDPTRMKLSRDFISTLYVLP